MIRRTDPNASTSLAFHLEDLANDLVKDFEEYDSPSQPEGILNEITYLRDALEFRSPWDPLRKHSLTCLCRALTVYVHRQVGNINGVDSCSYSMEALIDEVLNEEEQFSDQVPVERIAVLAFTARVIAERGGFQLTPLVERTVICRMPFMAAALTMTTHVLLVYIKIPRLSIWNYSPDRKSTRLNSSHSS